MIETKARRHRWVGLLAFMAIGCSDPNPARRDFVDTLAVGGFIKRTYRVHLPPGKLSGPTPLVLAFHGLGISAERMESHTGLNIEADRAGIIVVYPESYSGSWDADGPLDVPFVLGILNRLAASYDIDQQRIVAVGLSNGATFAQQLGCELADRLAGVVSVSGTLSLNVESACTRTADRFPGGRQVSSLFVLGSDDAFFPIAGGFGLSSADSTMQFWAVQGGCTGPRVTEALPDTAGDGTRGYVSQYAVCPAGVTVRLDSIAGGGHGWPGAVDPLNPDIVGVTSRAVSASRLVVEFVLSR